MLIGSPAGRSIRPMNTAPGADLDEAPDFGIQPTVFGGG
jgi:hypothetical protein